MMLYWMKLQKEANNKRQFKKKMKGIFWTASPG